jgi:very-short-patch-repair endonuclease
LAAPYVPHSWYQAPQAIATSILSLAEATEIITSTEEALVNYVSDVDERFPHETLQLLNSPRKHSWLSRIKSDIPGSVRRQSQLLQTLIDELRSVETLADKTQLAFTELVRELSIPISTEMQVSKLPKVFELATIVASNYPFQSGWFDPEIREKLKSIGREATRRLELHSSIQSELSTRVEPNQLDCFIDNLDKFSKLSTDFSPVETFLRAPTIDGLKDFSATVSEATTAVAETKSAIDCMIQTIGLKTPVEPSIQSGKVLLDLATTMMKTGVLHGAWSSQASRDKLAKACESAIEDLEDADALQNSLKDRMSHRAFKEVSFDLVEQSSTYRSAVRRFLGGFSKYRESISELYKTSVPATKPLLEDFDILRRYHRRLRDVRDLADSHSHLLPAQHNVEDSSDWRRVLSSLNEYREFYTTYPEAVSLLPRAEFRTDGPQLQENHKRLATALNLLESRVDGTSLASICSAETPLEKVACELERLGESAQSCAGCWEVASNFYRVAPATIAQFHEDRNRVSLLRTLRDELARLGVYEEDHLPISFSPVDPKSWQRLSKGLDAAERIVKMTKLSDQNCDKLCQGSELNPASLAKATRTVFNSYIELDKPFESLIEKIELSPPGKQVADPQLKSSGALSKLARLAADEFSERIKWLDKIATVIKPKKDVVLDELAADAQIILRLQIANQNQRTAKEELQSRGIDLALNSDFDWRQSADWLLQQGSKKKIPKLLQTVSSDRQLQARLKQNHKKLVKILNADYDSSWQFLQSVLDIDAEHCEGVAFSDLPIGEAAAHLSKLCAAVPALDGWLRFVRWRRDMHRLGFATLVDELLEGQILPEEATDCLSARFYRSLFDQIADQDIDLGEFDLEEHEKTMQRFRQLDEWEVRAAAGRIRQYQLGKEDRPRPGWYTSDSSELGILQREAQKKRRHKPLRKLFSEIPSVFQRLKPCIMMSPLSVSTFLQSNDLKFDLVIFDEASQVFPWDAMGAIYRGTQLIVAGDEKQLPPTNFFNRADIESDTDDDDDDIGDYESILSLCKSIGMPNKRLRWHYRSRREPLIAFSNQHFYAGDLVTFPSVHDASGDAIRFEFVENGCWSNRKNLAEAERVADLIIDHLRTSPSQSLGVIALNVSQQQAIEDAIFQRRRHDREIDVLLDKGPSEPLFVKNLENVQGDERDVIILSIAFAKNEAGGFSRNFGALSRAGGGRRLNVAITRARLGIIVVSSIRASELDLSDIRTEGSHLLKAYLEYAEHGVDSLVRAVKSVSGSCDSPFEEDVALALAHRGLNVVPQVGCGGFRIDLAISHPTRKGEFCLGVECDGASYHSSHTARDRDRIRQAVLEGLGWKIIRIWSTDWIRDSARQIDRVVAAYERVTSGVVHDEPSQELEEDDDDLSTEPTFIKSKKSQQNSFAGKATFKTIEEVPDSVIVSTARGILMRVGSTDWDDLVRVVTRELGFMRTGSKIRGRIEGLLQSEAAEQTIRRVGDRVMPVQVA